MRLPKPPSLTKLHFYCDASSQRNHNFMVATGVALRAERASEVRGLIREAKQRGGIIGEMKWSKYRGGHRRVGYEAVVDLLFKLVAENSAHFHVFISEFSAFSHKDDLVPDGSPEKSVNKMYFQLCVHRLCKFYGQKCEIHVFPDKGNDSDELPAFREVICARGYNKYSTKPNCLRQILPLDSESHEIIQMVDVVTGAIAAHRNSRQLSSPKAELRDYVLAASKRISWAQNTPFLAKRFTVWNFRHQDASSRSPRK